MKSLLVLLAVVAVASAASFKAKRAIKWLHIVTQSPFAAGVRPPPTDPSSVASVVSLRARRAVKPQSPLAFTALETLRGRTRLTIPDQFNLIATARAGQDYPNLVTIPQTNFDCSSTHQPGFYADASVESRCQVFHRCDINGNQTSYLCPNMSVFNQITLTCSWFFDVDCSKAASFADYSNSRLYQGANVPLLDDAVRASTGAVAAGGVNVPSAPETPETPTEGEAPAEAAAE